MEVRPATSAGTRRWPRSSRAERAPAPTTAELSTRESEVLQLLAQGYLYKEIADTLGISLPTVNTYIRRIYEKLHVRSRAQAIAKFAYIPMAGERVTNSTRS